MESSLDRGPTVPTEPEKVCEGLLYKSGSIAEECNDKAEASRSRKCSSLEAGVVGRILHPFWREGSREGLPSGEGQASLKA